MTEEAQCAPSLLSTNEDAQKLITETNVKLALQNDKGSDAVFNSFNVKDFTSKGDNYACFVTSVVVNYSLEGQDEQVTYVVKLNPFRKLSSFESFVKRAFMKEARFYTELVPDLNAVLIRLGQPVLKLPRCYYSCYGDRKQIIYLEDMRPKSFKMFDRMKGMDPDHVVMVVQELARLHATSSILEEDVGVEEFKNKYSFMDDIFLNKDDRASFEMLKDTFCGYVRNGGKIAGKFKDFEKVAAGLEKMAPAAMEDLESQVSECDARFKVVCHGDCWINNLLFRYNSGGKPDEVCLLDLQINRSGSICLDLNYLFFTSLNGATRKEGLSSFLSSYFTSFQTVFSSANKQMKFTQDELYKEYRKKNLFGLLMALMVLPIVVMESTEVPDFQDVSDEKFEEMMEEYKQRTLDMIETSPALRPRMLDMFDEMYEHGVIRS